MQVPVQARRCQLSHQAFLGERRVGGGHRHAAGLYGSCRGGSGRVMQGVWL